MRGLTVVVALLALIAGAASAQVNQEMIDRVTAGEITEARASWWDFDEEDATEALQAAINSGARKLIVENMGRPWIVSPLFLASNQEIIFEEGCEILAKRGEYVQPKDAMINILSVENVTLSGYGATMRMRRDDYDDPTLYTKAEWRHVINMRGASNINILGLLLTESGGDGIYLGAGPESATNTNVQIRDVVCDRNYRQGISVITAENLLIESTVMSNTGGTAPQAGIDFEPNRPEERLVNVVMRNCVTENNDTSGYFFYLRPLTAESIPVSVRIENCRSIGDLGHGARVVTRETLAGGVRGTIEFADCVFENTAQPGINVSKPAERGLVRFERCAVINTGGEATTSAPIVLTSLPGADTPMGGVEFEDVCVIDAPDRDPMAYIDQGVGIEIRDITGNLILMDPGGTPANVELTEEVLAEWMPVVTVKQLPLLPVDPQSLVPLVLDSPAAATDITWPIVRRGGEFLLYAREGEDVSFTVNHMQLATLAGSDGPVRVTAPSGEVVAELNAEFQQQTPVSFVASETGVYRISVSVGANRV